MDGPLNVVCSNATTYRTLMPQSWRRPQHQKRQLTVWERRLIGLRSALAAEAIEGVNAAM
jgi:hypothetical protein